MPDRKRQQQDRNEDDHGRQRRTEDWRPYLSRAVIGSRVGRHAALPQPEYIFQRHNRGIDNHADREGQPGKRDHIDRQAEPGNGHKGADNGHRNGRKHDDGRQDAPQEQHQDAERQKAAHENVLLNEVDGRSDIFGLVIDDAQIQVTRVENSLVQHLDLVAEPLHRLDDIHPRRTKGVDNDGFLAIEPAVAGALGRLQADGRDIGQQQRHQRPGRRHVCPQHNLAGCIRGVVHRLRADGIGAFALGHRTDAHHRGRGAERVDDFRQRDPVEGQLRGIDENPHFLVAATIEGDLGHAVDASERLDDLGLEEIAKPFKIDLLAGLADQRQPCDRTVVGIGCADFRRARI